MRYFLIAMLSCMGFSGFAQINKAEYFIDTDPGFNKAIAINFTSGNDVAITFNVPLSNVSNGFHTLYVRTRDAKGKWSLTAAQVFYSSGKTSTSAAIVAAEYFLDTDPGKGKGNPVQVNATQPDVSFTFKADLTQATTGFHTLYVRTRDNNTVWSQTAAHIFYVRSDGGIENITSLKYYFTRTGYISSTLTYSLPKPAPSIDLSFKADLSQLAADAEYTMYVVAINSRGIESASVSRTVKVCSTEKTKAGYDFTAAGLKTEFKNSTVNAANYSWDFGDGGKDNTANPSHIYTQAGTYDVKLIASSYCYSDTLVKKISVALSPKQNQVIIFNPFLPKKITDADFTIGASANSGLGITYTSSNASVAVITEGKIHIVGAGKTTITATQNGNDVYAAASATQELTVGFALFANNFKVSTISESCRTSDDGQVTVTTEKSLAYTATLASASSNKTFAFTDKLEIKTLAAGTYSLCIGVNGQADYKQCFDVLITEPKDLAVQSTINKETNSLNLVLQGGNTYHITLNGIAYTTSKTELTLPLSNGNNPLLVSTDRPCQGAVAKTIAYQSNKELVYPNPFENVLTVSLGKNPAKTARIIITSITGHTVFSTKVYNQTGLIQLNLPVLMSGLYMLRLSMDNAESYYKIMKR